MNILPFTEKVKLCELNPQRTGLLIVDMNVDFAHESGAMFVPDSAGVLPNIERLARACRSVAVPVLYAVHAHHKDGADMGLTGRYREPIWERKALIDGTPGVLLHPQLQPQPGDIVFKKQRHNAFFGTPLALTVRNLGLESLIVVGTVTQVCCESTVRAAFFRDLIPILVSDAVAPLPLPDVGYGAYSAEQVQRFTLTKLGTVYAKLADTTQLERWLGEGGKA